MNLHSVTLSAWDEIKTLARHGWIYRGQPRSGMPLETSLERSLRRNAVSPERSAGVERELLREFRRAYRQFAAHVPDKADTLEWLSLMQHHGAPTRLLDFSRSIYIAAYFALETADGTCSILAVDMPWAYRATIAAMERRGRDVAILRKEQLEEGDEASLARLFLEPPGTACACRRGYSWSAATSPGRSRRTSRRWRVGIRASTWQGSTSPPHSTATRSSTSIT